MQGAALGCRCEVGKSAYLYPACVSVRSTEYTGTNKGTMDVLHLMDSVVMGGWAGSGSCVDTVHIVAVTIVHTLHEEVPTPYNRWIYQR